VHSSPHEHAAFRKTRTRSFASVETWVFDSTTRSIRTDLNLWRQIDDRIRSFVSNFLKVSKDEAFRVQKDYYKRYGTTMRGLMARATAKPDDFLNSCTRSIIRRCCPMPNWATRSRSFRAGNSS
jgi:hypothetical protein